MTRISPGFAASGRPWHRTRGCPSSDRDRGPEMMFGEADSTVIGRHRRLMRLAGPDGIVAGIALDHRDSLRVTLERHGIGEMSTADLRRQKRVLARTLAPVA